jgi:hypothetical protein
MKPLFKRLLGGYESRKSQKEKRPNLSKGASNMVVKESTKHFLKSLIYTGF